MNTFRSPLAQQNPATRSMGFKLITVGLLALLMTVPAWFVDRLVEDRSHRAAEVSQSLGSMLGGPQVFLGPVLAVPYRSPGGKGIKRVDQGVYLIFPTSGEADAVTKSELRHRSLFHVPVYTAALQFKAAFDVASSPSKLPENTELDWSRAEIITGASDSRGALADATLTSGTVTKSMALSALLNRVPLNSLNQHETGLKIFGLRTAPIIGPGSKFEVTAAMKFSGARSLSILPFAKSSSIAVRGNWQHPSFQGGFLPVSQSATTAGFEAHWSIPFIARGLDAEGPSDLLAALLPMAPAVAFVELADPYQSVTRSVKYAFLFLSLVFSAFFIFEVTTGKRVHPAQYILIGVAQLIFYLLLLSIAERIGFGNAFAIASLCTVSLISVNANWIFHSRRQGWRAFAVFSLVYGLIYLLLTLEDQALLIGSVFSFLATAAIMYFTRSIDWYSQSAVTLDSEEERQEVL